MDDDPDDMLLSFLSPSTSFEPMAHPLSPSSTISVSSHYPHSSSPFSSLSNQQPFPVEEEPWGSAEQKIREIFSTIQPTLVSEQRRKSILNYVRRLIKSYYGIEVFPFGSVPLKTYLPDGDIDLTAIGHRNMEEDLGKVLCNIIKDDQQDSEFIIQDVQYIPAQVKIVKCVIGKIPVDISFNQMAGLSALCFLEKVDQLVGKDHLFKRSIALTKTWCYYESRILGAHHGLISTYALETLVLCIINLFHSSLCGPLAVLHKFMEYFSTFDWHKSCVTINGPIALSLLQETPEYDWNGRLLTENFLSHCRETLSVPLQALETTCNDFSIKHMNIVDPLKSNNNLGRSVSKGGHLYRIQCALSYGVQRLDEILELPGESMNMRLEEFFCCTLDRNGRGQRSDVLGPVPILGRPSRALCDLSGDYNCYYSWLRYGLQHNNDPLHHTPMGSLWNFVPHRLCIKQSMIYHHGPEAFPSVLPSCHRSAPNLLPATSGSDDQRKSRGTGTFIPDRTHIYRGRYIYERENSSGSAANIPLANSPPSDYIHDLVDSGISCFNLSLEQFPLLPCCEMRITLNESNQPTLVPMVELLSLPTVGTQEKQGSTAVEGESSSIAPYQLKDSDEFPPLSASKLRGDDRQGSCKGKCLLVTDKGSDNIHPEELQVVATGQTDLE